MAAAPGRPRHTWTRARLVLLALVPATLAACGADGDSKRSGPPGGGVDPNSITSDNLAMHGGAPSGPERVGDAPTTASAPTGAVDVPSPSERSPFPQMGTTGTAPPTGVPTTSHDPPRPMPALAGSAKAGAKPPAGSFTMTATHCQQIGRKVGQLTLAAGGDQSQADHIGNDFAAKCTRDQVGQVTEQREFDCIMAMKAITDLPSCK